ncbi:hypothetical protein EDB59_0089 [Vibrio crassostreae]|uniref:hypothetical protein n=1 Tax=Vibrio crassostreae TaxID=246167 RepID=UPI000FBD127F|nr:hypothetical protein [Vibrio crassostreae]ROR69461.1 hypothetical protein EDB59_0089 [Vibrio crassostreae]
MSNEIKCYDGMVNHQVSGVISRKKVIEDILRDMDCNSFTSFTALTDAVAAKFTALKGEPMSGSTIRRKGSKYKSLVESYYKTEERIKSQFKDKEAQLEEELMLTQLELSQTTERLNDARKALISNNTEMDRLRLSNIESRTAEGSEQKFSEKEVAAYKAMLELVNAYDDFGVEMDGYCITGMGGYGDVKTLIGENKCPAFFQWYREQLKG